jgi:hypothetical protein
MNYVGTESIERHKSLHTKRLEASLGSPCWKKFVGLDREDNRAHGLKVRGV